MTAQAVVFRLQARFNSVGRSEVARLKGKLASLADADRVVAESVIAEIVNAFGRIPDEALADAPPHTADALARLFALDTADR